MNPTLRAVLGAGIAVGIVVAPFRARIASATAKIANVRLAAVEGGSESASIGVDSAGVVVLFDYTGASRTKMRVIAYNNGGDALVATEPKQYTGDGTARVEISAATLVHGAAEQVEQLADNILSLAELGGDDKKVDGQIIDARLSLERDLISLGRVLVPMDKAALTGDALAALQTIDRLLPQVEDAVTELKAIPLSDVAAMRARLAQLEPIATELSAAGGDLNDLVAALGSFNMGALYADNAPYTFAVKVDEVGNVETTGGSADLVVTAGKGSGNVDAVSTQMPTMTPRISASIGQNNAGAATRAPSGGAAATSAPAGSAAGAAATAAVAADPTALRQAKLANATAQAGPATQPAAPDAASAGAEPALSAPAPDEAQSGGDDAIQAPGAVAQSGSGAGPLPTFTVPAGAGAAGQPGSSAPSGGGPNLLVLGGGVVALIGLALWFRRRV